MIKLLKGNKLLKSFSHYILANLLGSAISFLMLPLFTYYLTPSDYGILSLINSTIAVLSILIMVGADGSVRREFYNLKGFKYSQYFSSAAITTILSLVIVILASILLVNEIIPLIEIPEKWFYISIGISAFSILPKFILGQYRVEQQSKPFVIFSISMTLVNMLLGIYFVASLKLNYEGRAYSLLLTNIVFSFLAVYLLYKKNLFTKKIKKDYAIKSLKYGLPIIPHQVGVLIINLSDRYFIANFVNIHATGLYNVGYTIGSLIGKIEGSFSTAFIPFLFEELKKNTPQADKKVIKVSWIFIGVLLLSTIAIYLFAEVVFRYVLDPKYYDGKIFVPLISLGYFFSGCYKLVTGYIFYANKTVYLTYLAVFNVIVNVSLNYFLIKNYGAMGAAYATAISFFLMFLITFIIAYRIRKMPWLSFL